VDGQTFTAEGVSNPTMHSTRQAAPYMSPYLAGVGIGVVLLLSYVIAGRGLGASGAFSSVVTAAVTAVAPTHAATSEHHAAYAASTGVGLLRDWLVIEVLGITIGGFLSGLLAGRVRWGAIDRGPAVGRRTRIAYAFAGGVIMGIGAKLARGCTSGQALTGGALLSVGSWTFVVAAFAAAFAVAPLVRRQWR
jgi:uncharacterized membrane protein YedE/YeeE